MSEFHEIGCIKLIEADLADVTDEQIRQCDFSLEPAEASETVILETAPDIIRRLWTLSHGYMRAGKLAIHASEFDVCDDAGKKVLDMSSTRLLSLAEICRDICWTELRDAAKEVGGWTDSNIGMRRGFKVVISNNQASSISLDAIPVPMSVLSAVARKLLRRMQGQPEDEPAGGGKPS